MREPAPRFPFSHTMAKTMTITPEAIAALRRGTFTDPAQPATCGFWLFRFGTNDAALARPIYDAANKALVAAGGKWNKGLKAHVFNRDPREELGLTLETGKAVNRQQMLQLFPTPPEIAADMVRRADIKAHHAVLEPSAGTGRILDALPPGVNVWAVEKNGDLATALALKYQHVAVACGDFLQWTAPHAFPEGFDRIVMNPPFERGADIKHVEWALRMLAPGGRLVCLVAGGPKQGQFAAAHPWFESWALLPAKSFAREGTEVNVARIQFVRP